MDILETIKGKIDDKVYFQPILFLGNNDKIDVELNNIISNLFSFYEVDKNNIYKLLDDGESLKIETIRNFISKSSIKSSFKFQIFLIENISRLTLQSANAMLKFLEEPGEGNIIFLTNNSESGLLETILSRVSIINIYSESLNKKNEFYYDLIDGFIDKNSNSLFYYFFDDKKITNDDYVSFLNNLIIYIKEKLIFIDILPEIENAINLIKKGSISPKYLIDRIIIKIGN